MDVRFEGDEEFREKVRAKSQALDELTPHQTMMLHASTSIAAVLANRGERLSNRASAAIRGYPIILGSPACICCIGGPLKVIGFSEQIVQEEFGEIVLSGEVKSIPVVVAVCEDCGFIMNFSAKKLGLL